jgi:gentisate 1,2-dioxygenase
MNVRHDSSPVQPTTAREQYCDELRLLNLSLLWSVLKGLVPVEPVPAAKPWRWSWQDVVSVRRTHLELQHGAGDRSHDEDRVRDGQHNCGAPYLMF